jgi:hypothetical protein
VAPPRPTHAMLRTLGLEGLIAQLKQTTLATTEDDSAFVFPSAESHMPAMNCVGRLL